MIDDGHRQIKLSAHIKAILLLPFFVTVIIPFVLSIFRVPLLSKEYARIGIFIGILFFSFGFILFVITIRLFHIIGNGTLAPWSPAKKLVISGPYLYCRNPMISGVLFILAGESLMINSIPVLTWLCIFFVICFFYFYCKEEPELEKRFGNDYVEYKKSVPRWIPKFKPYHKK